MQKRIWLCVAAVLLLFSGIGTAVASRLSDLEREIPGLKSDFETKAETVEGMGDAPFIRQRKQKAAAAADAAREKYHAKLAELDEARRIEAADRIKREAAERVAHTTAANRIQPWARGSLVRKRIAEQRAQVERQRLAAIAAEEERQAAVRARIEAAAHAAAEKKRLQAEAAAREAEAQRQAATRIQAHGRGYLARHALPALRERMQEERAASIREQAFKEKEERERAERVKDHTVRADHFNLMQRHAGGLRRDLIADKTARRDTRLAQSFSVYRGKKARAAQPRTARTAPSASREDSHVQPGPLFNPVVDPGRLAELRDEYDLGRHAAPTRHHQEATVLDHLDLTHDLDDRALTFDRTALHQEQPARLEQQAFVQEAAERDERIALVQRLALEEQRRRVTEYNQQRRTQRAYEEAVQDQLFKDQHRDALREAQAVNARWLDHVAEKRAQRKVVEQEQLAEGATGLQRLWRGEQARHPGGRRAQREQKEYEDRIARMRDIATGTAGIHFEGKMADDFVENLVAQRKRELAEKQGQRLLQRDKVVADSYQSERFFEHPGERHQGDAHEFIPHSDAPRAQESRRNSLLAAYGNKGWAISRAGAARKEGAKARRLAPVFVEDGPLVTAQRPAPVDPIDQWQRPHDTTLALYHPPSSPEALLAAEERRVAEAAVSSVVESPARPWDQREPVAANREKVAADDNDDDDDDEEEDGDAGAMPVAPIVIPPVGTKVSSPLVGDLSVSDEHVEPARPVAVEATDTAEADDPDDQDEPVAIEAVTVEMPEPVAVSIEMDASVGVPEQVTRSGASSPRQVSASAAASPVVNSPPASTMRSVPSSVQPPVPKPAPVVAAFTAEPPPPPRPVGEDTSSGAVSSSGTVSSSLVEDPFTSAAPVLGPPAGSPNKPERATDDPVPLAAPTSTPAATTASSPPAPVATGNSNKGALAIAALLATLTAGGIYKLKNWSSGYDGLSNDEIDKLEMSTARRVMLKVARRGRQLFGASFGKKPTSAKEAAAPVKLTVSKKGKKAEGLMTRMKKSGWNLLKRIRS